MRILMQHSRIFKQIKPGLYPGTLIIPCLLAAKSLTSEFTVLSQVTDP